MENYTEFLREVSLIKDASVKVGENEMCECNLWSIEYLPGFTLYVCQHNPFRPESTYFNHSMGVCYLIITSDDFVKDELVTHESLNDLEGAKQSINSMIGKMLSIYE